MSADRQLSIHRYDKPDLLASQPRRTKLERPTAKKPLIISASELATFLRCRVQHHWSYRCQLGRPEKPLPLAMGILGHAILEDYYGLAPLKRTVKGMQGAVQRAVKQTDQKHLSVEDRDLLKAMCIGYAEWTRKKSNEYSDTAIGLEHCVPEEWFDFPLTPDGSIRVRGKLDARFESTKYKKTVGILESKFKSAIRYDDIENRLQLTVYLWALRQKFPKMKRYIAYYQILRKQMPGPRVKSDLFFREPVERDGEEIDQWAKDTQYAALDMLDGAVYPSPMESCSWSCDFKIPCLLRGNDADLHHVLTTEYTKRKG